MAVAASATTPLAASAGVPSPVKPGGAAGDSDWDFSFHDFVSIVNPLQHLPIVSTLYRKLTGDTIKPLERIAGDTLFAGWMGLVSSVANVLFEKETGKDFGDTVLAFLEGDKDTASPPTQIASGDQPKPALATRVPVSLQNATIAPQPVSTTLPTISATGDPSINDPGAAALSASMSSAGVDPGLGQRALYAYRRSMGLTAGPTEPAPPN